MTIGVGIVMVGGERNGGGAEKEKGERGVYYTTHTHAHTHVHSGLKLPL